MKSKFYCALILVSVSAAFWGCALGPDYHRPVVQSPERFRFEAGAATNSLADLPWWEIFKDPVLQGLIRTALTNNNDLKRAVARVEEARNQSAAANSAFLPQVGYGGDVGYGRNARYNAPAGVGGTAVGSAQMALSAAWEVDVWGRVRRSSQSAQARYLATEEARRGVMLTLVSEVAGTYFQLLELDQEVSIQRAATNAYSGSYRIFNERLDHGVASKLETDRAAAALANAAALIPQLEIQRARAESRLSLLLGRLPGPIARRPLSAESQMAPEIPAGLPSELLRRRPDVRGAEQLLIAANAGVGVSVANFFPQIGLTTFLGRASPELSAFTGGAGNLWDLGGTLSGPVFQGGRLRAEHRAAQARFDQAAAEYQQSVLTAFQEVSDALVTRRQLADEYGYVTQAVAALESSVDLALQRYLNGKSSYYEVLQAQQELYPTRRALVQVLVAQWLSTVQLYKALGGGWQAAP